MGQVEQVIDFGENQPFRGAEMVRPTIVILKKAVGQEPYRSLFIKGKVPSSLDQAMETNGITGDQLTLQRKEWTFQSASTSHLADRLFETGAPLKDVVNGRIFRGVTTGSNESFVIDGAIREELIRKDSSSAELIKPFLAGQDLRPWYHEPGDQYLIFTRQGTEIDKFPAIKDYLGKFRDKLEPRPGDWNTDEKWIGRKPGEYEWFEIQDTTDYFREFDQPKIVWPDIAKLPRFSWDESNYYLNNTAFMLSGEDLSLLALLQSRLVWFIVCQMSQPLRERGGLWQYRLYRQYVERIPIPIVSDTERDVLRDLALRTTAVAQERRRSHQATSVRILSDLGSIDMRLNQRLKEWWKLDFDRFRVEAKKHFKRDIAVRERDDWSDWLRERQKRHSELTETIIGLEQDINYQVYGLFDLSPAEIEAVEQATKYPLGEV